MEGLCAMQVKGMPLGPLQTNCYWLIDEASRRALLFDPGFGPEPVIEALKGYQVEAIILTHGHWDHVHGVQAVKEATGAPVWISEIEKDWLTDPMLNRSGLRRDIVAVPCTGPAPDRLLREGETFSFAGWEFRVLHTPGHTPGSLSFATEGLVIAGDVLFQGSVGRTDLPGGSMKALVASIREKLFALPDETVVLPGHGPATTIGRERRYNPFVGNG